VNVLILDDNRERVRGFRRNLPLHCRVIWERTASRAIRRLKREDIYAVFLDHDLDPSEGTDPRFSDVGTGMDVVAWVTANQHILTSIGWWFVHSLAPTRAETMVRSLQEAGLRAVAAPWSWAARTDPLASAGLLE